MNHPHRTARAGVLLAALLLATVARAATPTPLSLPCDVVYKDKAGKVLTVTGELVFEAIPIKSDGKPAGVGINELIPSKEEPTAFTRTPDNKFHVKTFRGEKVVEFAFDAIPVKLSTAEEISNAIDTGFAPDTIEELSGQPKADLPTMVTLAVPMKMDLEKIDVNALQAIRFKPPVGFDALEVGGRYLSYSKNAKGSDRALQIAAATFFGGPGSESFVGGAFLPNGDILAVAPLPELTFAATPATVIGKDPSPLPAAPPPPSTQPDASGRIPKAPVDPRLTAVLVRYSADLKQIKGVTRLAWGSVIPQTVKTAPDGSVYIAGRTLEHFPLLLDAVDNARTIPNPEATAKARDAGKSEFADSSFLLKLSGDGTKIQWLVFFPHRGINFDCRAAGELLVESRRNYFVVSPEGAVTDAPARQAGIREGRTTPIAVSPIDNAFYIGGEYNSHTGREPYRNPFVHKFAADGKAVWTGWNWTGRLVGTDYFRQVSDSAARILRIARNGDLLVVGWSDGGNTVWQNIPYDLEGHHGKYGYMRDMSAASVGSFCHILRLNSETMEVLGGTIWMTYHPYTNKPNSAAMRDIQELADGRWVATGGAAFGLIETHDAWVTPYVAEAAANPKASPKGGTFFTVFDAQFRRLLFSTQVPGLGNQQIATRGKQVLLTGSVKERETSYGSQHPPLLKDAVQKTFGGGATDGYIMLINTAAGEAK